MPSQKRTLREWRAYLNLTKKEMSIRLEVHPSTYSNWEAKPMEIRLCDVYKLASALGCEPNEIIFFESKPSFKLGELTQCS